MRLKPQSNIGKLDLIPPFVPLRSQKFDKNGNAHYPNPRCKTPNTIEILLSYTIPRFDIYTIPQPRMPTHNHPFS